MTNNELQKRIISALVNAPKTALQALIDTTDDKADKEQIKRIAKALKVNLEGNGK